MVTYVVHMDSSNEYLWPVVRALAAAGFMGMVIPRAYDGQGRLLLDVVLVVEEIAKLCGTVVRIVVDANTAVAKAIAEYGTEEQRRTTCRAL